MVKLTYIITSGLFLISISCYGQDEFISNSGKQILSNIRDAQIEKMLEETAEFKKCRDQYKFRREATTDEREKGLEEATKCFQSLTNGKSESQLVELSKKLKLQHFQLIQNNNSKEIQDYLDKKLHKSLTGVDREESDLKKIMESFKFKSRKFVDHALFFKLYKTQLGKNAMYEISRFCFEKLRQNGNNNQSFATHWANYKSGELDIKALNDFGYPKFGSFGNSNDKNTIYKNMLEGIQTYDSENKLNVGLSTDILSTFFSECGMSILPLCKIFEEDKSSSRESIPGGAACLTKNKLKEIKIAYDETVKIEVAIKNNIETDKINSLVLNMMTNFYEEGAGKGEESVDQLTNYSTDDLLRGKIKDLRSEEQVKKCQATPELASCEGILFDDQNFEKAKHNIELEMTLQREVERQRIRNLDSQKLTEYLKQNKYFDILDDYNKGDLSQDKIAERIVESFEAKKVALLQELNAKMGRRQVQIKNSDPKNSGSKIYKGQVDDVINEANDEKIRMAQVLLFNNIITGHLNISESKNGEKGQVIGKNTAVLIEEEKSLVNHIDPSLFENLRVSERTPSGSGVREIKDFKFINQFLGEEDGE